MQSLSVTRYLCVKTSLEINEGGNFVGILQRAEESAHLLKCLAGALEGCVLHAKRNCGALGPRECALSHEWPREGADFTTADFAEPRRAALQGLAKEVQYRQGCREKRMAELRARHTFDLVQGRF
jgi:hypothetical protein